MDHPQKEQFILEDAPAFAADADIQSIDPGHDVKGLQRDLEDRLRPDVDEPASGGSSDQEMPARSWPLILRRVLKVAVGLAIVAVFGWLPFRAISRRWSTPGS
jgi:hypothetical protein